MTTDTVTQHPQLCLMERSKSRINIFTFCPGFFLLLWSVCLLFSATENKQMDTTRMMKIRKPEFIFLFFVKNQNKKKK